MKMRILLLGVFLLSTLGLTQDSYAGGLYLPLHGTRGVGRAGAFVAGADDPGGLWYNPATLSQSGRALLIDATAILHSMDYTRVDSGGNSLPGITNDNSPMPIPTIALSWPLPKKLHLGFSLSAGSGVLPTYNRPSYQACGATQRQCIDTVHYDAPARYSLVSLKESFLLRVDLALSWRIKDWVSVGVSLQTMAGRLSEMKVISSYNGTLSSGPEDPDFDSLIDVKMNTIFNPSAKLGALFYAGKEWTLGFALQLPLRINSDAELAVQLPTSPLYAASTLEGKDAEVTIDIPLSIALGVEYRPIKELAVEFDAVFENWAAADEISFTPKNIVIHDLPGIGDYLVPTTKEALGYRNTYSIRIGAEYNPSFLSDLSLRAGYGFETGATPVEYTSLVSADFNKHLLSAGLSYQLSSVRFDLGFAAVVTPDRVVDYRMSKAKQNNPISPENAASVGGGSYSQNHFLISFGTHIEL